MFVVGADCEYFDAETRHWLCTKVAAVDEDMSRVKVDLVPDYWLRQGSSRLRQVFLHLESADFGALAATHELPMNTSSSGTADVQLVQPAQVHPSNGENAEMSNPGTADIQKLQAVQVRPSYGGTSDIQPVQPVQVHPSNGETADIQPAQVVHFLQAHQSNVGMADFQPMQTEQQRRPQLQPQQQRFPVLPNTVPLVDGVDRLEPEEVHRLLCKGDCLLVDVRGEDRACGWIAGSVHFPAVEQGEWVLGARLAELSNAWSSKHLIIFHCQYSCHRAPHCANAYKEHASPGQRVGLLAGGFRGWEQCGRPTQKPLVHSCAEKGADAFALLQGLECARQAGA